MENIDNKQKDISHIEDNSDMDDNDLRYKIESDKSLIYDSETNKDICMYFSEEGKDFLLKILNSVETKK